MGGKRLIRQSNTDESLVAGDATNESAAGLSNASVGEALRQADAATEPNSALAAETLAISSADSPGSIGDLEMCFLSRNKSISQSA
jgi:hypothetical protein